MRWGENKAIVKSLVTKSIKDLEDDQETLSTLEDTKLVKKLPRQPGRNQSRYTHLLSGEPDDASVKHSNRREPATLIVRKENDRSGDLQEQIDTLRQELQNVKLEFEAFKLQFE